jgi:predicted XRE-type DNA-binding protein
LKQPVSDTIGWEDKSMSEDILDSCGNVFLDLGLPPDEAAILQIRAELLAELRKFIKSKKLSEAKAAQLLSISKSRLSDLVNGRWEQFSLEMLVALATRAGMHIHLKTAA